MTNTNTDESRQKELMRLGIQLADAWKKSAQIPEPPLQQLPQNRAEAYIVQDAMAYAIGDLLAGWKVGATSAKMRELDGHTDVIPGRIFNSKCWRGTTLSLPADQFPDARVETEFAFQLKADLPLRGTPWQADELTDIAAFSPAIEIIGNRHSLANASAATRSLMTVADNGGGIGFVFGDSIKDWQSIDFQQHAINLRVDGGDAAENFLGDMRCVPIQALADLANHLQQRGIGLNQGAFVSTGAATIPQHIAAGSQVVADFGSLGTIQLQFE